MKRIGSTFLAGAALALLLGACASSDEEPIPFEISRVVLPKDIPPPSDERNAYGSQDKEKSSGSPSNMASRTAAAEAQERMHARSASVSGQPDPAELVKVKVPEAEEGAFLTSKSFVTRWNILGPLHVSAPELRDDAESPLQKEYFQNEKTLDGSVSAPEGATWNVKVFSGSTPPGLIDLKEAVPLEGNPAAAYYATACLDCPEDVEGASLMIASTLPLKVWLNGTLVHAYDRGPRELKLDQDAIEGVYLRKGYNRLVVKCVAPKGAADRKFMIRFATAGGAPISTEP